MPVEESEKKYGKRWDKWTNIAKDTGGKCDIRLITREDILDNYEEFCKRQCGDADRETCSTCPIGQRLHVYRPTSVVVFFHPPKEYVPGKMKVLFSKKIKRPQDLRFAMELSCTEHDDFHPRCEACRAAEAVQLFNTKAGQDG